MKDILIGNPPKNKLPRAKGFADTKNVLSFGPRDLVAELKDKYVQYIGGIYRDAVQHPGDRVVRYFEENGYEYEEYAIYDPKTNTITTNRYECPSKYWHHLGSTCSVCGLVG